MKTQIVDSWKDPGAGPIQFKKIVVFFLNRDRTVRGFGEEEMVLQIKRTNAVPSLALFQDLDPKEIEKIREQLKREGFDGAVVMHILSVEEELKRKGGTAAWHYRSFVGYWDYAWPMVYGIGYPSVVKKDRTARVETVVYSLAEDKLIWAAMSETSNPESIKELVAQVADAVGKSLRDNGLLK
jgi:hypothetical protein